MTHSADVSRRRRARHRASAARLTVVAVARLVICGLVLLLVGAFLLSLALGSTSVPLGRVFEVLIGTSTERDGAVIVVETIRLPRSLTALLAGAALGIAGLQMQTLFRNPLADPFALGISSGASLGVALVVLGTGHGAAAAFGASTGLARRRADHRPRPSSAPPLVLGLVLLVSSRGSPIRRPC